MSIPDPRPDTPPFPEHKSEHMGATVEVSQVSIKNRRGETLLDDISLFFPPGELVVVTGSQGTSLSALLQVLAGLYLKFKGKILFNGLDLAAFSRVLRYQIGYVPQQDALPLTDRVQEVLRDAARLGTPREMSEEARRQRIAWIASTLGLQTVLATRIAQLSGQIRRLVSIAVEAVKLPALLLIDMAEEGLDAHSEVSIAQRLRGLAGQGITVVVASRTAATIQLADKVAVLAPGGSLAWFGPPSESLAFFGKSSLSGLDTLSITSFDEILFQLEEDQQTAQKEWAKQYQVHPAFLQYTQNPLSAERPDLMLQDRPLNRLRGVTDEIKPPRPERLATPLGQLAMMISRSTRGLLRSRLIGFALLAPILTGVIDILISSPSMSDTVRGNPLAVAAVLGMLVLSVLLLPGLLFSQLLSNEEGLYRRERRAVLATAPYLLSKVWLVGLYGLYLSLVIVGFHYLAAGANGIDNLPVFWASLFLLSLVGGLLGLLSSALASTPVVAGLIAMAIILPQAFLGGVLTPIDHSNLISHGISLVMPARLGFEALLTASGLGKDVVNDSCWLLPPEQRILLSDSQKQACNCMGVNIFSRCNFPGVHRSFTPAIEQAEPQPPDLGDNLLPIQPIAQPGQALEEYAAEVNEYTLALEIYQGTLDSYISNLRKYFNDFGTWQRERSLAVGRAEEHIALSLDSLGPFLGVSLLADWLGLLLISLFVIVLLFVSMKRKGVV